MNRLYLWLPRRPGLDDGPDLADLKAEILELFADPGSGSNNEGSRHGKALAGAISAALGAVVTFAAYRSAVNA